MFLLLIEYEFRHRFTHIDMNAHIYDRSVLVSISMSHRNNSFDTENLSAAFLSRAIAQWTEHKQDVQKFWFQLERFCCSLFILFFFFLFLQSLKGLNKLRMLLADIISCCAENSLQYMKWIRRWQNLLDLNIDSVLWSAVLYVLYSVLSSFLPFLLLATVFS